MQSKLGELIEQLVIEVSNQENFDAIRIIQMYREIQEAESPLYPDVDFEALKRYYAILFKLGATEVMSAIMEEKPEMLLAKIIQVRQLLMNPTVNELVAYTIKHTILLMLAEQRAKASGVLGSWTVLPEQTPESHPNSDPPVPLPDEPPATS